MDFSRFFGEFNSLKKNLDKRRYTKLLVYAGISMILIGIVFIIVISFILLK